MNHDLSQRIREKVDIVDIVGERIPLTARGKNFFGVCPFHEDQNPSLCVSRDKQIYTCFSCHATGNVFTFLMNYEHKDFKEVLHYLGEKVGIDVSGVKISHKNTKYDKLYDAYKFSVKYFNNNLLSSGGREARNYLKTRGFDSDVVKEFNIGLSLPTRDDLTKLLISKGYSTDSLNSIGLSSLDHDIYVDRVMFPLDDVNGNIVGFSGRIYKDVDQNKYLNTKETEIFKKGQMLYHFHKAMDECRLSKSVIVMEGFMDVIRAWTVGVKNTVALMGTAMTSEHINLLKRLSKNIILCLDGDNPGQNAMLKNGQMLVDSGLDVKIIKLPKEDDPDTFILNNGKERFEGIISSAINFSDYKINHMREGVDFRSDAEKAKYINDVIIETAKLDDDIRIEIVLKKLAKEFDIGYNTLEMRLKDLKESKPVVQRVIVPEKTHTRINKYQKAVYAIFYFMLNNDWVISLVDQEKLLFPTSEERLLSSEIIYYYNKYGSISVADFYTYAQENEEIISLLNSILAGEEMSVVTKDELFQYFKVVREYSMKQEIKRLTELMKKEVDPLEQAKIVERIRKLRIGDN